MGVEEDLKKIIIDRYGSVNKFATVCDVSLPIVHLWTERP